MDEAKKVCQVFKICKYTFLIFEKGSKQENSARYFKTCKYSFFYYLNRESGKYGVTISKYCFFQYLKNRINRKLCQD